MKKTTLLNQPISAVIAGVGHTDTLVVADAGLPIPPEPQRIDLALSQGVPAFLDTVQTILTEMQIERAIVAAELIEVNPDFFSRLKSRLGDTPVDAVSHEQFKSLTGSARAVVRTGEFTPYANVILVAGVVF